MSVDGSQEGRTLLLDPSAVAAAYTLHAPLTSSLPFRTHLRRVFGINSALLQDIDTLERLQQSLRTGVTAKYSLDTALRAYAISLERQIAAFGARKFSRHASSSQIRFDTSLRRLVQIASIVSFFGPSFPADDLTIPLIELTESIAELASTPNVLQRWTLSEVSASREKLVGAIERWLGSSGPDMEASELVRELRQTSTSLGSCSPSSSP